MDRLSLYEEYRLIERSESEVNAAWKGAHLLLFFLAFVFGSFCTFCFHMLMYLFDEKCVLFPKLLFLNSMRHSIVYEFIPLDKDKAEMLPVDFITTQWVDKSSCYLPTYVPLASGIFGLVWTTMFLMCTSGSRSLTGLQRPWRLMPPVFVFSLALGGVCLYTSIVTHKGLNELCSKLGEVTGSPTCTYTVNVATLLYERKIRGVYQAMCLTKITAWLHTSCWLLSALLALLRVLMAVDFRLVRVEAVLHGNIDKMLERHEKQLRTISPDIWIKDETDSLYRTSSRSSTKVQFKNKAYADLSLPPSSEDENLLRMNSEIIHFSENPPEQSEEALVQAEKEKLSRITALEKFPKEHKFIAKILYDILDRVILSESTSPVFVPDLSLSDTELEPVRQYGQEHVTHRVTKGDDELKEVKKSTYDPKARRPTDWTYISTLNLAPEYRKILEEKEKHRTSEDKYNAGPSKDDAGLSIDNISLSTDFAGSSKDVEQERKPKKSNLKNVGVQTKEKEESDGEKVVRIDSKTHEDNVSKADQSTVTDKEEEDKSIKKKKEKQD